MVLYSAAVSGTGRGGLRLGAYVLLGDPAFVTDAIAALVDVVDRLVLSYDGSGLGWTGRPLPLDECLAAARRADPGGKIEYVTHQFHDPADPMAQETGARQAAIDHLGHDVDWVLQFDTDEVMADPDALREAIGRAAAAGRRAVDFPSRWLYAHVRGPWYLERCQPLWRIEAGYPGQLAVAAGTRLTHARQSDQPVWRVDFKPRSTDRSRPKDAPVDQVIGGHQGIWHFSWVRTEAQMRAKALSSGHTFHFDWTPLIDNWVRHQAHPVRATLSSPMRHRTTLGGDIRWLRPVKVPLAVTLP